MACSWGKGSDSRCGQSMGAQSVPGNSSFRQDWPIQLCEDTDCETTAGEDETVVQSSDWEDPCDENSSFKKPPPVPPGPLENFDIRVRKFLEGDIWANAAQAPKHRPLVPNILKKAAAGVVRESESYSGNESEFKSFAKNLMSIEKTFRFEQALKDAEAASATAPEEKIEEIALATARGFTMSMDTNRETTVTADGSTVVEVISYCGVTKPHLEHDERF